MTKLTKFCCLLVLIVLPILIIAQVPNYHGNFRFDATTSGTLPNSFQTIWDTNTGFLLYYCADPNVGNTNIGTLWTYSGNSSIGYTNGLIAYSNVWVPSSNSWIIYSNTVPLYSQSPNVNTAYGAFVAGIGYAKGKGMFGGTPAPFAFGYPFASWAGGVRPASPVMFLQTTTAPPQICITSAVPVYAPNFIASMGLVVGTNCGFQIQGTESGNNQLYPMAVLGGSQCVVAGQLDTIISSGLCTNFDLNASIIDSSSCTLLRGLGDDFILGGENVLQQNLGSSVCGTIACFGVTNFSTGTSVQMGSQNVLMDGGCVNFVGVGQFGCYNDVNEGFATGTYQTNGLPPGVTGGAQNSGIYDIGNGNTITTSDTIFLGFTNAGIRITATGGTTAISTNSTSGATIANPLTSGVTFTAGNYRGMLTVNPEFVTATANNALGWLTNLTSGECLIWTNINPFAGVWTNGTPGTMYFNPGDSIQFTNLSKGPTNFVLRSSFIHTL